MVDMRNEAAETVVTALAASAAPAVTFEDLQTQTLMAAATLEGALKTLCEAGEVLSA